MPDYLPHTDEEIAEMLAFLGLSSLDELFDAVPAALRIAGGLRLAPGIPEPDVLARARGRAEANRGRADRLVCFAGAGAYDHEVPPVVRALAGRSEFVTAYTPYQAEVAQGGLQAIFEFQTMVSRLFGLPIANASLYDGASAVVEAVNLGVGSTGRPGVLVSAGVHPHWRAVLATFAAGTGHRLVEVPLEEGRTRWDKVAGEDDIGVVVVGYPNYLGCLEDLAEVRELCDQRGAVMAVAADPVAAGVLRSPGEWGADVAVGEGQPFGTPLSFGGPYLGLFACSTAHVRRLPGRLVGQTLDGDGRLAYVTTLRAREQDIRREKATSNVCTNQTLMALTAAIQLGWLGTTGLAEVATRCARGSRYCRQALVGLGGVEPLTGPTATFREFAVRLPLPARVAVERLADEGFLAGVALEDLVGEGGDGSVSEDGATHGLLVAVTERRSRDEIDRFVAALDKAVR
ncbi:MAG TPA: aminomethyl-transferring glycine dehydrogenase subunit GcvPA [Acidimicrobiales bacterium]|nr:aminomethyl-transferring glycine dehydrogenase subunit GcvPA [Acidimicrobiales bacterium]